MDYTGQNQGRQEETHHPTHRFRRFFPDLFLMGWRGCTRNDIHRGCTCVSIRASLFCGWYLIYSSTLACLSPSSGRNDDAITFTHTIISWSNDVNNVNVYQLFFHRSHDNWIERNFKFIGQHRALLTLPVNIIIWRVGTRNTHLELGWLIACHNMPWH